MSVRPSPVRISTSIAILFFDWLVFALNMTTHMHEFASSTVLGACAAGLTVAIVEQHNEASAWRLISHALFAAAVVAIPFPLAGTAVAALFLIWSAVAHAQAARAH